MDDTIETIERRRKSLEAEKAEAERVVAQVDYAIHQLRHLEGDLRQLPADRRDRCCGVTVFDCGPHPKQPEVPLAADSPLGKAWQKYQSVPREVGNAEFDAFCSGYNAGQREPCEGEKRKG